MNTTMNEIAAAELRRRLNDGGRLQLVDVREYPEYAAGHLPGARLVPLAELERRAGDLDREQPVVLMCRSGRRSGQAREKLAALGFTNLTCLEGGLMAWEEAGFAVEREAHAPWALERQVRLVAGLLVLLGVALGAGVHPAFYGLSGFVGAGQSFAAVTDWCGMDFLLAKMPWNRPSRGGGTCKA